DLDRFAWSDVELLPIVHHHMHVAGDAVAEVVGLAALGPRDRLNALGPAPAGLEDRAHHHPAIQMHDLDRAVLDWAGLVGGVECLALKSGHKWALLWWTWALRQDDRNGRAASRASAPPG